MRKAAPPRDVPPPLELVCLRALWLLGEGNAGDVQRAVSESKPLAYTTVLTLLDRLARKGVLDRRKQGRSFIYIPRISRDHMRRAALRDFLDAHFDGDERGLRDFLSGAAPRPAAIAPSIDATLL